MEYNIKKISQNEILRVCTIKLIMGEKKIMKGDVFLSVRWVENLKKYNLNTNNIEIQFWDENNLYLPVVYKCTNIFYAKIMFSIILKFLEKYENHVMYESLLFNLNSKTNNFIYPTSANENIKFIINTI
jgi:hypothetical protein